MARIQFGDVMDNLFWRSQRRPIEESSYLRMIGHVPGNVDGTGSRIFGNGDLSPSSFLTKPSEFLQARLILGDPRPR